MANELQSLRSERRALREELATRTLRRQVKAARVLTESYDYFDRLVEVPDTWVQHDRLIGPAGTLYDRRDGQNAPVVRTLQDLELFRGLARVLRQINYVAIGLVDRLTDFVVDTGIKFRATPKQKGQERALKPLLSQVQSVIDEFYDRSEFDCLQRELFAESITDGEDLLRHFIHPGQRPGYIDVRAVGPEQLRVPAGESGVGPWSFGIYNDPDDIESVLWYHVCYIDSVDSPDGISGEDVPAEEMIHTKRNVVRRVKRGLSDFFPVAEDLEGVRKLLHNLNVTSGVQAAVAWVRQFDGAQRGDVERLRTNAADYQRTSQTTGKEVFFQKSFPGAQLDMPAGMQMAGAPSGTGNVSGHVSVVQALLRGLTSRWGMPEYFTGDASNNNFASILVAGSPFVRKIKAEQMVQKRRRLQTIWLVIRTAMAADRLPKETLSLVTVQAEATAPEFSDQLVAAQKRSIELHDGVLSPQTAAIQAGYDPDQEMTNIEEYHERFPDQGAALPVPFQLPNG